jgi:hypothetical protein
MNTFQDNPSPGLLQSFWDRWKRTAKRIGDIQARMLLTVFYFVLLAPFALALRRWSDPLAIKSDAAKGWRSREAGDGSPKEQATRQF